MTNAYSKLKLIILPPREPSRLAGAVAWGPAGRQLYAFIAALVCSYRAEQVACQSVVHRDASKLSAGVSPVVRRWGRQRSKLSAIDACSSSALLPSIIDTVRYSKARYLDTRRREDLEPCRAAGPTARPR